MDWAPFWLLVLCVLIPFVFPLMFFFARKTGRIAHSLGEAERRKRKAARAANRGLLLLAINLCIGTSLSLVPLSLAVLLLVGILIAHGTIRGIVMRDIRAARIEHGRIWLVGIPAPVMAALASAGAGDPSSGADPSGEPASSTTAGPTAP